MGEVHSGRPPIPGVAGPARAAINDIFQKAHREGRSSLFEHEVYRLLAAAGIASTPRHEVIAVGAEPTDELLASFPGSRVVVKIVSGSHCPQIGRGRGRCRGQRADGGASRLPKHACNCAGHRGSDAHRVHRSGRRGCRQRTPGRHPEHARVRHDHQRRNRRRRHRAPCRKRPPGAGSGVGLHGADHCRGIPRAFQADDWLPEDRRPRAGRPPARDGRSPRPVLRRLHPPREQPLGGQSRDRLRHRGTRGQPLHLLGRLAGRARRLVPDRPAAERPPAAASGQDRQAAAPGFDRNHRCIRHAHELRPDHPEEHHRIRL